MKKIFVSLAFLTLVSTLTFAQKYGHLNFGNIVSLLPETKQADSDLEAYQKQLVAKGEEMAGAFQEAYGQFVREVQSGDLTPKAQQEKQAQLQQKQQEIVAYENEVVEKVQAKRQELLKPLLEKVDVAIKAVAKENGYQLIFDTSLFNAVLFAQETDDILPQVKAKLGIN